MRKRRRRACRALEIILFCHDGLLLTMSVQPEDDQNVVYLSLKIAAGLNKLPRSVHG
jgi:hypothetical protein